MKNLLPILALLLLVGCTNEPAELERCIKANTKVPNLKEDSLENFNLELFTIASGKIETSFDQCISSKESAAVYSDVQWIIFKGEREIEPGEITKEQSAYFEELRKENLDEHLPGLKDAWNYCRKEYKRIAIEICNSQGIY